MIPNTVPNVYAVDLDNGSRYPVAAWGPNGEVWAVGSRGLFNPIDGDSHYDEDEYRIETAANYDDPIDTVQIIPSGGWYIVVREGTRKGVMSPVVAWALCRDGSVRPLVTDGCHLVTVTDSFDALHPDGWDGQQYDAARRFSVIPVQDDR